MEINCYIGIYKIYQYSIFFMQKGNSFYMKHYNNKGCSLCYKNLYKNPLLRNVNVEKFCYNNIMKNTLSIEEQLKLLPTYSGVYLMFDSSDTIIYIGKAKNLKRRVKSYFKRTLDTPKLRVMVPKIVRFEFIVTDTEVEALILESHLIKKHKPCYNVLLKDDKKFPWFVITNEEYPRIVVSRRPNQNAEQGRYFGPYTNSRAMYSTLELIKKIFPLRQCKTPRFKNRTCIYHQIGRCSGVCQKEIAPDEYKKIVKQVELFLTGKQEELIKELETEMTKCAEQEQYEKAARYRDSIIDMRKIIERQNVVSENTEIFWDIIGFSKKQDDVAIVVLKVRNGRLIEKKEFDFELDDWDEKEDVLNSFFHAYYDQNSNLPTDIIIPFDLEEKELLENWLYQIHNKKIKIINPKAQKKYDLLQLANKNALLLLEKIKTQKNLKMQENWNEIGLEIQEKLNLQNFPHRMECFDISHIQGTNTVASMVVFENGRPQKSEYRRFKIKTLKNGVPDDFAAMEEVVRRRYSRTDWAMPDLIIIDGGKGQLSSASGVLRGIGHSMAIVSLAKRLEEVFVENKSEPVIFPQTSGALFVFQKIRDEAHRFAINYHRKLRENQALESVLDEIKGISENKKKLLFEKFQDIKAISQASVQELEDVVGKMLARRIYNHFSK